MRKSILMMLAFLAVTVASAQTNQQRVDALRADIAAYGQAVKKIVSPGKSQEGIDELTSLISRSEQDGEYAKERLATYYRGRGQGYLRVKQYSAAISDYTKAIELLQKSGSNGFSDLSNTWYQLSLAYYYSEKKTEAMAAVDKSIQTALEYYGPLHSATLDAYSLRSNFAGFYGKSDIAMQDRVACFEIIQKNIEKNFTYLTAAERTAYWNKNLPETSVMFAFAHKMDVRDGYFVDAMYNQQLLAKGLLITAESSLQRTIESDASLKKTYNQIRLLRKKASDSSSDFKSAAEATLQADKLERELTASASGIGRFLSFLSTHADDVKAKLTQKDVAIEFVDYRVGKDSTMYAALIMSPRWQHARFIPLAEKKEIEQNKDNLSTLVWEPIIKVLPTTVSDIYFAPSGLLYQIPIESHKLANDKLVCESYNLYRLSSTRWLAINGPKHAIREAVLYGDLQYDTSVEDLAADMVHYPATVPGASPSVPQASATTVPEASSSILQRGAGDAMGLSPLPATRVEVESIQKILAASNQTVIQTDAFTGKQGTETSFKALSTANKQIIHIATHGFFNQTSTSDNALLNAGLCFAGANNKLQGEDIPTAVNDGILTAEEVSQMDLSGLDMLTLSACETGLGTISHDGVFGLQRGFKKAGANSILMSLWKVDDAATCKLMTEFYSNWIGKKVSKHDALEAAKKTVRETKGWEDPKYWAAFILLDALD